MNRTKQSSPTRARRLPAPLVGFGALLFLSLSLRCGGRAKETTGSSTRHGGAGAGQAGSAGMGGTGITITGGGGGAFGQGASGIVTSGTTGIGGATACTDAFAQTECPLPPSTCAADGLTLNYYLASCPAGYCVYSTQSYECMGQCAGGACLASTTTASGFPPPGTSDAGGGGQAGDGNSPCVSTSDCQIPASTCVADDTLDYYVVQCLAGQCVTQLQSIHCSGGCFGGACQSIPTK